MFRFFFLFCFFFQAEDGIRDLVRSRGLGDVYKRQGFDTAAARSLIAGLSGLTIVFIALPLTALMSLMPVSYTHLTLPTSDLV